MRMPAPWVPTSARTPIVIYGAGSAVGAFAVKLASLSKIHPIIAIAGRSSDYVKTIINTGEGDVVIDYRQDEEGLLGAIQAAVPRNEKISYAFDAISTPNTINLLGRAVDPGSGMIGTVLKQEEGIAIPSDVQISLAFAPDMWEPVSYAEDSGKRDLFSTRETGLVFSRYLEYALANDIITPHPYEVLSGGLGGIETGLKAVKEGKNSGLKYLYRIAETK
jgi:NADPH2:quinone reductase